MENKSDDGLQLNLCANGIQFIFSSIQACTSRVERLRVLKIAKELKGNQLSQEKLGLEIKGWELEKKIKSVFGWNKNVTFCFQQINIDFIK